MTIEEMRSKKGELGLTYEEIAEKSGMSVSTVQKVLSHATKAPRKKTLDALERALGSTFSYLDFVTAPSGMVAEPDPDYDAVPYDYRHTVRECYCLPDDRQSELIDGVLYDMGEPSGVHQLILGELYLLFRECIEQNLMAYEVFLTPFGVRLNRDDYTMVKPDLCVVCEYGPDAGRCVEGAPDLVVEILSPSSRAKDMVLKLYKYQDAGVREYWIVDPKYRTVTVHHLEKGICEPEGYRFSDIIPIGVSDGICRIDFSRILVKLRRYYES